MTSSSNARYNVRQIMSDSWSNPLYPFDNDADSLEEAARETEWEEDTRKFAEKRRRRRRLLDEDYGDKNDWTPQ